MKTLFLTALVLVSLAATPPMPPAPASVAATNNALAVAAMVMSTNAQSVIKALALIGTPTDPTNPPPVQPAPGQAGSVTVGWQWTNPAYSPASFSIYGSQTLVTPMSQWSKIANIPCLPISTNVQTLWTNVDGTFAAFTNVIFQPATNATITVQPAGQWFLACVASNYWGETGFSNVAATPPIAGEPLATTISR
jgi:hypothetical protein